LNRYFIASEASPPVHSGAITGDPLRMNAAAVALKFERPALAATLQATVNVEMTPEQIDRRLAELIGRAPPLLTAEKVELAAAKPVTGRIAILPRVC
jgi:hypothetical protein